MATIKNWIHHRDKILSLLCRSLIDRRLYKVKLQAEPIPEQTLEQARATVIGKFGVSAEEAHYLVFTGVASNTTYNLTDERISILFKDGTIKDISEVDNALIQHNLSSKVKKHYICCMRYA